MTDAPDPKQNSEQNNPPAPDLWANNAMNTEANQTPAAGGWERGVLEELVLATVREQRAARRWRVFIRLMWLLLFAGIAWALFSNELNAPSKSGPHTAVVEIKGEIAADADASAEFVMAAMRRDRKSVV